MPFLSYHHLLGCLKYALVLSPLNIVGMPYYDTPLLSNFSLAEYATASSPIFHPPAKIPTSILSSMRVFSGVGYAVLPQEMPGKRRGKFVRGDAAEGGAKCGGDRRESGPRFRSEKSRAGNDSVDDVSLFILMTLIGLALLIQMGVVLHNTDTRVDYRRETSYAKTLP
jgi:hypothetical protein